MEKFLKPISTCFFVCLAFSAFCQNAAPAAEDDEFNIILLVIAGIGICTMLGAAIVFAALAIIVLLACVGLVSAGIFSASILIGLYKKSFSAGFKSLMLIGSSIGGAIIGLLGLLLIGYFFPLKISTNTAFVTGSISGLLGGFLVGFMLIKLIRFLLTKFNLANKV